MGPMQMDSIELDVRVYGRDLAPADLQPVLIQALRALIGRAGIERVTFNEDLRSGRPSSADPFIVGELP